eukprot:Sspe_Gene.35055::Locus_17008_Transcript_2_3_Confidence_0.375_Length_1653::g.35055::m.35055
MLNPMASNAKILEAERKIRQLAEEEAAALARREYQEASSLSRDLFSINEQLNAVSRRNAAASARAAARDFEMGGRPDQLSPTQLSPRQALRLVEQRSFVGNLNVDAPVDSSSPDCDVPQSLSISRKSSSPGTPTRRGGGSRGSSPATVRKLSIPTSDGGRATTPVSPRGSLEIAKALYCQMRERAATQRPTVTLQDIAEVLQNKVRLDRLEAREDGTVSLESWMEWLCCAPPDESSQRISEVSAALKLATPPPWAEVLKREILRELTGYIDSCRGEVTARAASCDGHQSQIELLQDKILRLEDENGELRSKLVRDASEMRRLQARVTALEETNERAAQEVADVKAKVEDVESQLDHLVSPRRAPAPSHSSTTEPMSRRSHCSPLYLDTNVLHSPVRFDEEALPMISLGAIPSTVSSGSTVISPAMHHGINQYVFIHAIFDNDHDGYLGFEDAKTMQLETEGTQLEYNDYKRLCEAIDVDPKKGLSVSDLIKLYRDPKFGCDLERDIEVARRLSRSHSLKSFFGQDSPMIHSLP